MAGTLRQIAVLTACIGAGVAKGAELKYPNMLTQCPMTLVANMETSTVVLNAVMANASEAILNKDQLIASEYLDYTGFTGVMHAQDFQYKGMNPYWTANVVLQDKPKVSGPGGMCDLAAVDLLPADDSTGAIAVVELRFILENCANGKHGAVSTYIVGRKTPGTIEEKELVPWMCAIRGRDCQTEEAVAKNQVSAQAALANKGEGSVITIGRKIENKPILHPDGSSGKCNNTGMGSVQRDASTEEGCLLECMQRLEMDVASSDVDVMHECSGYTWKDGSPPGVVPKVEPICVLMYELPHSDKAVTSADMNHAWRCVALRVILDTYDHSTTTSTTTGLPTTTTTRDLALVPLNLYSLTAEPTMATRKIISPIPGFTGSCFETSDWYVIDRQVYVNPDHWKLLTLELQAQPVATMPPVVPSDILLDRVCVMGAGGVLPPDCTASWEDQLFPLSLFLNAVLILAILAYLCHHHCWPRREPNKFVRVKEIVYEDMTRAQYPFEGTPQNILPGGQHEYVLRDKGH